MAKIRVQVALHNDSGLDEDDVVNTWHFTGSANSTDGAAIVDHLETFYDAFDDWLSNTLSGSCTAKLYNIDALPSGPPFYTETFTITPGTGQSLPSEVALCLSYQAAQTPGLDQRNRRGRIYLGPFADAANTTSGVARPNSTMIGIIGTAATALATAAFGTGTPWHVYSSTLGTSAPVVDGWIDNAWDTQRRRGVAPTTRTTWT